MRGSRQITKTIKLFSAYNARPRNSHTESHLIFLRQLHSKVSAGQLEFSWPERSTHTVLRREMPMPWTSSDEALKDVGGADLTVGKSLRTNEDQDLDQAAESRPMETKMSTKKPPQDQWRIRVWGNPIGTRKRDKPKLPLVKIAQL